MISFVCYFFTELNINSLFRIRAKYSEKFNVEENKFELIYKEKAVLDTDTPISIDFKGGDIVCVNKK